MEPKRLMEDRFMAFKITDDCVSCGTCVDQCPSGAIVDGDEHYVINDDCVSCGTCIDACPTSAIIEE
jgi:ferredoxin